MGVHGLWPILQPCARPTPLPTLNRKRLAVDASIWIYQFLKAVRDKDGNALRNSHVVGFFRRICKLLYFGIKPVFVFDGGAPILKRQTITGRKRRREGRRDDAVRTAGKLLAMQMKQRGEEEVESRKKDKEREERGLVNRRGDEEEVIDESNLVYAGEMDMLPQERQQNRTFRKTDAYHLPDLHNGIEGMGQPNDPRIMSAEELEEYARQFNSGEDINLYDFSKIDFSGDFFTSLPAGDRYNILNAARLRSRLRMGLSKEQLEEMFPDRMEFSRFQIDRVKERNELTQRLMNLNGMNAEEAMFGVGGRIAGEQGREYVLVKNDGVEGGWVLGVVSTEKGIGDRNRPIDVDKVEKVESEESEEEDEFEDVPVEGLNRLPKVTSPNLRDEEYQDAQIAEQHFYNRRNIGSANRQESEEAEGLFVDGPHNGESSTAKRVVYDEEDDDLNRAIAMSLQQENDGESDGEEHLNRAMALSMQQNHPKESESEDNDDFEDVPIPEYQQRAVADAKPILASSGKMVAHIVNNRANAAVPKRRAVSVNSESDSDLDLQSALAKARRQKAPERRKPAPVVANLKNPFDGPLPFESLNFKKSIFGKKGMVGKPTEKESEVEEDDLAGGFERDVGEEPARPLPPWLAGGGDIRSEYEEQQRIDMELNAKDREMVLEDERRYQKQHGPIIVESSDDDDSDVEIVDAPPQLSTPKPTDISTSLSSTSAGEDMGGLAENIRADPPVPKSPQTTPSPVSNPQNSKHGAESDEEAVDWSDSDDGVTATKPAPGKELVEGIPAIEPARSPGFSDTVVTNSNLQGTVDSQPKSPMSLFEGTALPASELISRLPKPPEKAPAEIIDDQRDEYKDYGDFSDPEDEELLAQLATEAEEHARFASSLNNRTEYENQQDYEKELKALRNQQKKDRRDADEVSHIMITECQALLRLFGIPYITAPMEAEAQCAELVNLGLVDGVVTDDCDIFLFGGTRVYKNMFNSNKFVECYLSSDIEKDLSLSRDQLIAIAHLLGSDYTEGLSGIGPVTALEILSEFPTPSTGLEDFRSWWKTSQYSKTPLSSEPTTFRKKFRRSQATKLILPPGFPSSAVTEAYLKPDVDSTPEPFQWGVPDLDRLRDFLMATIGWTQERTDEVLVPVIRDMNQREQEGTQSNITRFFEGAVGAGANTSTGRKEPGSKRMREAVGKLKAKKSGLGGSWGEEAARWAEKEEANKGKGSKAPKQGKSKTSKAKGSGKSAGKKRSAAAAVLEAYGDDDEAGGNDDGDLYDVSDRERTRRGRQDVDDSSESEEEYRDSASGNKGKGKGKGRAPVKRKRAKI